MATKKKVKKAKSAVKKKPLKKKVIRKAAAKKTAKRKTAGKSKVNAAKPVVYLKLQIIGKVTHFFPHVSAGVVKLAGDLKCGDMIQIKGHTTDFRQTVDSMQLEHAVITEAKKGQEIGLKVKDRVRIGDVVYKI